MKTTKTLQKLFRASMHRTASIYTSCACYYILLSVLPAVMLLLVAFSNLPISQEAIFSFLKNIIPDALLNSVVSMMQKVRMRSSVSLFSASVLIWLWSASKGVYAISDGIDAVLEHSYEHHYIRQRLSALIRFLLLSACLLLTASVYLFGEKLLAFAAEWVPGISQVFLKIMQHRMIASFVLLTVTFSVVYRFHPGANLIYRHCILGGSITAAFWLLFTYLFSIYITHFSRQYQLFGDLATFFLAAIWIRYSILILFYGIKYASIRSSGYRSLLQYWKCLLTDRKE